MSDTSDEQELAQLARTDMVAAANAYNAAFGRPGIITGYIFVYELTEPDAVTCWTITGNGAEPTDANEAGLAPHRALGLIEVSRKIIKQMLR